MSENDKIIFDKKIVAYNLLRDALTLLEDYKKENFKFVIYNTIFTAWNLIAEITQKEAPEVYKKTIYKKVRDDKENLNKMFSIWNFFKHSLNEDPQAIFGFDNMEVFLVKSLLFAIEDFELLHPNLDHHNLAGGYNMKYDIIDFKAFEDFKKRTNEGYAFTEKAEAM